jgi:tetratricopeptide (TPR) repeat protein
VRAPERTSQRAPVGDLAFRRPLVASGGVFDLPEPPDVVRQRIRFALSELRARNGHHDFEHICRYIAQARISKTILPATGPVGAGGDHGRDFESFRTHIASHAPCSFVGVGEGGIIVGACTLQANHMAEKFSSDIARIAAGGPVISIYFFCEADIPVGIRQRLLRQARERQGVAVEVLDGNAIAELLMQDDLYWIAQRYLGQPARRSHIVGALDLLREVTAEDRVPGLDKLSDDALGSTPTRYTKANAAPYVTRPGTDGKLRAALAVERAPFPFVVLVGESKSGKSRTLIEAVRAVFGTLPVLIPKDGPALTLLAKSGPERLAGASHALIWLDDLTASVLTHLTGAVLNKIAGWATIVGTITSARREEILYSNIDATHVARTALSQACVVELAFDLTESELQEARRLYPAEVFTGSIAETLVAGEALLARLRAGRVRNPYGVAVTQAVVDWKRAGMDRPLQRSELERLFPIYLSAVGVNLDASAPNLESGLMWAKTPVASQVALIREQRYERDELDDPDEERLLRFVEEERGWCNEAGWVALDYIVSVEDCHDSQRREIPDRVWWEIVDMVDIRDIHGVCTTAHMRGKLDVAWAAISKSTDTMLNSPEHGTYYEERGEYVKAEQIYRAAIDSGDPQKMSAGRAMLGMLLYNLGKPHEAAVNLSRITDHSTVYGAVGSLHLAVYLEEDLGDLDGAEEVYRILVEKGHRRLVSKAARQLGWLKLRTGDAGDAIQPLRMGLETANEHERVESLFLLARALHETGELAEAEAVAAQAANLSEANFGFNAWTLLGIIRESLADRNGAIRAYDMALTFEEPQ